MNKTTSPATAAADTINATRLRLIREAQDRSAIRMQNSTTVGASDSALRDLRYAIGRIERMSDDALMEKSKNDDMTSPITSTERERIAPREGVVGFYESDPGGPKSPNTVCGVADGKVSVLEPSGLVFKLDMNEWMSIDEMESSTLAILAAEDDDLKELMLRGRIVALADAFRLMAARVTAVVDYAASLDQRELSPTGDDFNAVYDILLAHPGREESASTTKPVPETTIFTGTTR